MIKLLSLLGIFSYDAQLFADVGTLVNTQIGYQNAYTGEVTEFSGVNDLTVGNKTYYETDMLENAREKLIFGQLGKKVSLPANHGTSIEFRKWNKLPHFKALNHAQIPTGEKMGETAITATIAEYGLYTTIGARIDLHYVDDIVQGAVEEVGAAGGETQDLLIRNAVVSGCTNIIFADSYNGDTKQSTPTTEAELQTALASYTCNLTPDMVLKAKTFLEKQGAPKYDGRWYVCVINPSIQYDLMRNKDWNEYHKYAATTEIFNGEVGELYGVRFIVSNFAPVIKSDGQTYATYKCLFLGKDAFATIEVEGGGMEMILKDKKEIGGPLEQFSSVGGKFETATKVLYPERMVAVWCGSTYSSVDEPVAV